MGIGEPGSDLVRDADRARDRERPVVEDLAQALALEHFHRDVSRAGGFAGVVNRDDIAVSQAPRRAGVLQEAPGKVRAGLFR
ncbi:hypothetical protein D3C83_98030 [compost metagenome]